MRPHHLDALMAIIHGSCSNYSLLGSENPWRRVQIAVFSSYDCFARTKPEAEPLLSGASRNCDQAKTNVGIFAPRTTTTASHSLPKLASICRQTAFQNNVRADCNTKRKQSRPLPYIEHGDRGEDIEGPEGRWRKHAGHCILSLGARECRVDHGERPK
jgi:hypothetical protein